MSEQISEFVHPGADELEIGGTVANTKTVADGALVKMSEMDDGVLGVMVTSEDGLAYTRLILSPDEAEALSERLAAHAAEVRDDD